MPFGSPEGLLTRCDLMANPTASRRSSSCAHSRRKCNQHQLLLKVLPLQGESHSESTSYRSTDRSKAVIPVLVFLFVALWFLLRGDLLYVLPCTSLLLCFSVHLALRLPRLGKRELVLVLFVRLFDLRLFGFVCFLFLLVSGQGG